MNTFKKLGDTWCVYSELGQPGETVLVTKRNGQTSEVVLGPRVGLLTYAVAPRPAPAPLPTEEVGDLSQIVAMFGVAAGHLRFPSIVLDGFRVSIAGARAAQPGSLTVTAVDKVFNSYRGRAERPWFGRVSVGGTFEPGRNAPEGLAEKLRRFSADPAGEAAAHGHLTGRCCFCNKRLGEGQDQRSVAVGYGPDCADHYGLAWGTTVAAEAVAARAAPLPQVRRQMEAA